MKHSVFLFVTAILFCTAAQSFAQHNHGGDFGAAGEKMFSVGDLHIIVKMSPYPLERSKVCVISVSVHDMKAMQNVTDAQANVSVSMKGKTQDVSGVELSYAQDKETYTASFAPDKSGEANITLHLQGGSLTEKLSFAFSETIKEKEKFVEKMMNKGMEMHHKLHKNWIFLGLMGAAMLLGHNAVH